MTTEPKIAPTETIDAVQAEPHVHGPNCSHGHHHHHHEATMPFVRAQAKVGRNEACPCGSGQKFKKCCAKNE